MDTDTTRDTPGRRISIVIPTLNSARTLPACLESIRAQTYPSNLVEIIVADGGSSDDTPVIARQFGVDKIVANPLQTGEAGKSAGIRAATGDIIATIDSDNVLPSADWLTLMLRPFDDPEIVATEPLYYAIRKQDPALTRYFALLGMNDPLCLFLGNYDRYSHVTGRWTGLDVDTEDRGPFLVLHLSASRLPTIGANGFVFRRDLLKHVKWEPYFFDIDIMPQAVDAGFRRTAKVKCGIVHLYCSRLREFAGKQDRRVRDFLYFASANGRTYPWDRQRKRGVFLFCASAVLVFPLLIQMLLGSLRKPDRAWWYHVPVCWITLWVYGWAAIRRLTGCDAGIKPRSRWQQSE